MGFFSSNKTMEQFENLILRNDLGYVDFAEVENYMTNNQLTEEQYNISRINIHEKQARKGSVDSMVTLGIIYRSNDSEKCIYWFEEAAKYNNTVAMCELGFAYSGADLDFTLGVDKAKSEYWYKRAIDLGSTLAAVDYADYCCEDLEERRKYYNYGAQNDYWKGYQGLAEVEQERMVQDLATEEDIIYRLEKGDEYCKRSIAYLLEALNLMNINEQTKDFAEICGVIGLHYSMKYLYAPNIDSIEVNMDDVNNAIRYLTYADTLGCECQGDIEKISDIFELNYDDTDYQNYKRELIENYG